MYTFHATAECAFDTYDRVLEAYRHLLACIGVPAAIVDADSGNIGGDRSQEVHILSPIGEDRLLSCECGAYAANVEKARGGAPNLVEAGLLDQNTLQILQHAHTALRSGEVEPSQLETLQKTLASRLDMAYFCDSEDPAGRRLQVMFAKGDRVNPLKLAAAVGMKGEAVAIEKETADE